MSLIGFKRMQKGDLFLERALLCTTPPLYYKIAEPVVLRCLHPQRLLPARYYPFTPRALLIIKSRISLQVVQLSQLLK